MLFRSAMPHPLAGTHPGLDQKTHLGSWARIPLLDLSGCARGIVLCATIWPTTPARGRQVVASWRGADGALSCVAGRLDAPPDDLGAIYGALVLGLGDYVRKNRFPGVILGLSGGIDSALTAAVAVDALGAGKVRTVMMPSPYTSRESLEDAAEVARLLGVRCDTISIEPAMRAFGDMLAPSFAGAAPDITEENIQSRARGLTLMALSKIGRAHV